ncbi:MAG: hypothetical protein GY847_36280 [Proteobacteria bacterium]|nr:hypothetical protein [Pseudomonadota bacterium]
MIKIAKQRSVKLVAGAIIGGALGFAYYTFIGCSTGACPITSDPVIATIWGSVIGGFAAAG